MAKINHSNLAGAGDSGASVAQQFGRPTRTRYWVVFFAITLAVVTYIDRVSMSQAAPFVAADLKLTKVQIGWAFSAFAFAYALFEIPGGWLGDWLGPRRVLMRIVLWWSFFTAATGWAWNHTSLVVTRFVFGAGEAGCFPNLAKSFTTWLLPHERVRATGLMWLAARWAGAFTPLLVLWLIRTLSWRMAFQIFGVLGVIWACFFWHWYRDKPSEHWGVSRAEVELLREGEETAAGHGDVPWRRFLASKTVWMLWLQYSSVSYGWSFYITWLPTYIREGRGQTVGNAALLAVLPLFFGGIGSFVGGFSLDRLSGWVNSPRAARKFIAALGCAGAGALLICSVHIHAALAGMVIIGLASFCNDLALAPAWAACMDVGGKYTGSLSGSMNMMGNLGGAVAPVMVGYLLTWTHQNWAVPFYVAGGIYFLGSIAWMTLDPVTPLDTQPADH